jgi:sortase A
MRTFRRRLGSTLMFVGVLLIAYAAAVVFWRDPVTDLYAIYSQRNLGSKLQTEEQQYVTLAQQEQVVVAASIATPATSDAPPESPAEKESEKAVETVYRLQKRFAKQYDKKLGTPIGRLAVPGMGLSTIVVEGTDRWSSLAKGPGRYGNTSFPGSGSTVGIAGHRTTFSAPFRHIDNLSKGDKITLKMPYGTFVYRVRAHKIVKNNDWSIIKQVGHEQLVLSACHPLYSASHRWVVFADLVTITLPGSSQATPV